MTAAREKWGEVETMRDGSGRIRVTRQDDDGLTHVMYDPRNEQLSEYHKTAPLHGNTLDTLVTIDATAARVLLEHRARQSAGTTHWDGCWQSGPKHYECAVEEINRRGSK